MSGENLQVVILCGGQGTRMQGGSEPRPKMLVEIGGRPMLWHLMSIYAHHGHTEFILCLGYLGEQIRRYFLEYEPMHRNLTLRLGDSDGLRYYGDNSEAGWNVTMIDTGLWAQTGARVARVEQYIRGDTFFCTYGDGLGDVDLPALLAFHRSKGVLATLTGVRPNSQWGFVYTDGNGLVTGFEEKPQVREWVNGGFFVFERGVFDYLRGSDDLILEREPFERLAADGQLAMYPHSGFWRAMDTFKDVRDMESIWESGQAPWRVWETDR
jgi:glucose-1-phosphate cytidylyltransferase